ncbi:hypothetical protein dsx2_1169 [Desulfovibrio sp. X2]|uniref:glycosyltransferase n=1 Tax=Desulfovibrio sp. X2 TaxID=941449 RepID=UPI0003587F1A|nr:glycosyltransferase [Desulfovibrio sp. X2]EPR37226.1 hypothetical protein dsx2_1169 [Desulfovibrio sp. X2]
MKILTTVAGRQGKFWGSRTQVADPRCVDVLQSPMSPKRRHLLALAVAWRMYRMRGAYDVAVIDGGPIGQWFSWMQSLLPFPRVPTLMIDCLWYRDGRPLVQWLKRLHKRLSARSVDRFLVWARHEVAEYAREFGIPEEQFAYQPFHITLESYDFDVRDEGFVFAGGNGDRDYRVLVEAARGLPIPVFIATTAKESLAGLELPPNVTVQGVSHEEFRRRMATCRVAVVPMRGGLLHSGGQQTFLNSMYLGKPTIVVGPRVAEGYVEHGRDGLVVDYGDAAGLRAALLGLWQDEGLRARLAEAGRGRVSSMTTEEFMKDIYRHAMDVAGLTAGTGTMPGAAGAGKAEKAGEEG